MPPRNSMIFCLGLLLPLRPDFNVPERYRLQTIYELADTVEQEFSFLRL